MIKSTSGFTIIEILVTVVVIGIITSITFISYNGAQRQSQNTNRAAQLQAWQNVFEKYKASKGELPLSTSADGTGYCLGSGFPIGFDGVARCRDYLYNGSTSLRQSDNAALMAALQTVTPNLPTGDNIPSTGTVGPYVYYWGGSTGNIQITGAFHGFNNSDCPAGTEYSWKDTKGLLICSIYLNK